MLTRCLALLFIPILPFVPLMAPLSPAHATSAVVAGVVATVLAAFALVDDRARAAVAMVGGWVALSPFIFRSTLTEEVIAVCWGVGTFALMMGPLSAPPRSIFVAAAPQKPLPESGYDHHVRLAA
jgi:hypothetical protein